MSAPAAALHPNPRWRDVWREQVRMVGLALRREGVVAGVLMALATVAVLGGVVRGDDVIDFRPQQWIVPGLLGLLLPALMWRGSERREAALIWMLPVERSRHVLGRVLAGWAWLMAAVTAFVLWLLALTVISGGGIVAEQAVRLLSPQALPVSGLLDPAALRTVRWAPSPLLWLVPFAAATALYLLTSALIVGTRHPLRWVAGALVGVFLLAGAADLVGNLVGSERLIFAPSRLVRSFWYGRYGVEMLLVAHTDLLRTPVTLTTGETVLAWRRLPDPGGWAAAAGLWTIASVVALLAAAARHRERRRT